MFRYKIVVEVVIGEQRGEGVRMGSRQRLVIITLRHYSLQKKINCCQSIYLKSLVQMSVGL